MAAPGKRTPLREHLVEGLTIDERLARLEGLVLGNGRSKGRPGLEREHDETRRRLEDLESCERRRRLPWWTRILLPRVKSERL
jgi:hypothetical protein